jgi:serine/threonine-protein kinase
MPHRRPHRTVRHRGRTYPVIGVERVRGRELLLLRELGSPDRPRYLAFDPHAGFRGELRRLTVLPKSADGRQHFDALLRSRRTNDAFSVVLAWEERADVIVLVHEWVAGDSLRVHLDRAKADPGRSISPHQAVRLVKGLAHGLDWYHRESRLVHGDVTPENLVPNRQARRMVLIDFGSAWPMERTARRAGEGCTPSYGAPELQGAGGVVDGRADQFAASVVLYEMLTGELPYGWGGKAGRPEYAEVKAKTYRQPSALAAGRVRLPDRAWAAIDHAVGTGVAFDPDRRFRSDGDWAAALERAWRELDPVPLPPSSPSTGVVTRLLRYFRGG